MTPEKIVEEARTWLKTPWIHEARIKGAGVDCANFLIGVYAEVGLIEPFTPAHYPPDWMLHQEGELFLQYLLKYTVKVDNIQPGDVVMYKFGRTESHGAIVTKWPEIIHAYRPEQMVVYGNGESLAMKDRLAGIYRHKDFK
jgi:NlpC/P60 family putative phage cell wall peptidase